MKGPSKSDRLARSAGILLLFLPVVWAFIIHLPTLRQGYLNAGDDHIHVAFANELVRIWQGEGRLFGWSRLYATGAPIFLLRPPGFYMAAGVVHFLSGLTVEQALKLVVVFGFALYPLAVFACGRMLQIGFWSSVFAGLFSVLPVSLWGHTIDAYQYLGVHKQLLAILLFPLAVGGLWSLLREGRHGFLFAASFAGMFMTHPYVAYCFALLAPCMVLALFCGEHDWQWRSSLMWTAGWVSVSVLFLAVWLIPFVSSPEIQLIDPYLSRRKAFDVVVCTTAETLRQLFMGGILDTSRYAGPFGASKWLSPNEWAWLANGETFRFPVLTVFSLSGLLVCLLRPRSATRTFLALAFLLALVVFIGPDDFPVLDAIPFASQFQNIHAIFLFEWVAIMLAGLAAGRLFALAARLPGRFAMVCAGGIMAVVIGLAIGSGYTERTAAARRLIDVRNIYTTNGEFTMRPGLFREWRHFYAVVKRLRQAPEKGAVSALPLGHDDSVLYNLLPLMTGRPVFITGFEPVGGVFDLLAHRFRGGLRDSYQLQRLFNIRYVINSPYHMRRPFAWHDRISELYRDEYWQLGRVNGDFGALAGVEAEFIGFSGSERQWAELMEAWLRAVQHGERVPWLVNLTHAGMTDEALVQLRPRLKLLVTGGNLLIPEALSGLDRLAYEKNAGEILSEIQGQYLVNRPADSMGTRYRPLTYQVIKSGRDEEIFRVKAAGEQEPVLFKRGFYRGWEARLDGRRIPVYRISPGLQLVLLPAGEHRLSWRYAGPNRWPWAVASFLLGSGLAVLLILQRRRRGEKVSGGRRYHPGIAGLLPAGIWLVFMAVFAWQTISEAYYKRPVPILPAEEQRLTAGPVDVYWNSVVGVPFRRQRFEVQVAADPGFEKMIGEQKVAGTHARFPGVFEEPGPYYYRLRLVTEDRHYPWSGPVRFLGPAGE